MSDGLTPWPRPHGLTLMLARNWWAVLLRGIIAILFGLAALFLTFHTLAALVLVFGIYMLADGIFAIVSGVRAAARRERWGALILEGVVDLVAAAIAFIAPLVTIWALVLLCAAWAVVSGVMLLVATFRLHAAHGRWWMGIGAVFSILWGVLLFFDPAAGAVVMTWWLGAYALVFGISLIALSFRLRRLHHTPAMA